MKANNLDAVRLVSAWLVLYVHSYTFLGLPEPLFLSWVPLSTLGVYIFFILSGYLISESWERDPNLARFFKRRLLRILPGLSVCVLLCTFVLGPILTTLPVTEYLSSQHTWNYLKNIGLYIIYYLPGVFETNRIANAVNGSLWSLPIEFLMYILVAFIGVIHGSRWIAAALATSSAAVCLLWAQKTPDMLVIYNSDLRQAFICGTYFWVGACFFKFGWKRHLTLSNCMLAMLLMLCLEPWTNLLSKASWILLPIIALAFGFSRSALLTKLTKSGDYSYGIYIYAFPAQQSIAYLYPESGILIYIFICSSLTLILAALSWHLIEKRALSLKPRSPKRTEPANHSSAPTTYPT
ncbi:acyltransferase family protein [Aquipseudomonas alcaligenes]|uniref:acyltransferase family protein n=1 Tax=Aquipseudomonas alcaligenes TaxID=43263 RepID=UPI00242FE35A|nr:acyltransferase [Pseudomonas alcaligenes]